VRNDFSLWRNIMREFSEEFLGNAEHDGSTTQSIDYGRDEPFRSFERERVDGGLRVWHYGLVVEPLELGTTQLTVAVVDSPVFDRLFADMTKINDEGRVVGRDGRTDMPFTAEAIDRLEPRLSASALTLILASMARTSSACPSTTRTSTARCSTTRTCLTQDSPALSGHRRAQTADERTARRHAPPGR
jgi:hypothetical protein